MVADCRPGKVTLSSKRSKIDHGPSDSLGPGEEVAPVGARDRADQLVTRPKIAPMPDFGVLVLESRHAPGFATSFISQSCSEFMLIISGHARLEGDNRVFRLEADSLVHFPAKTEFCYRDLPGKSVTLYAIQYRDEILPPALTQKLASLRLTHWNSRFTESPLLRAFRSACKEMLFEQYRQQSGWETVLISRLYDLAVRAVRFASLRSSPDLPSFSKDSDSVMRVINYAARLESEFFHLRTLDDAALATGLSRRRFTALFRSVTGQSWHKRLLDLRLAHARLLLSQTDRTIIAVAFESGFEDLSHFNHVFRQAFGCSPSTFRRDHLKSTRPPAS
jgi:AraC-like DNA-binding protein/mannose-6-phosphate isomerase-like protein (cupin superfamily)